MTILSRLAKMVRDLKEMNVIRNIDYVYLEHENEDFYIEIILEKRETAKDINTIKNVFMKEFTKEEINIIDLKTNPLAFGCRFVKL